MARLERGIVDSRAPQDEGADIYFLWDETNQLYFDALIETGTARFDKSEVIEGYSPITLSRFVVKRLIETNEPPTVTFWHRDRVTLPSETPSSYPDDALTNQQMTLY